MLAAFIRYYRVDIFRLEEFLAMPWVTFRVLAEGAFPPDKKSDTARPAVGWDSDGIRAAGEALSGWSKKD